MKHVTIKHCIATAIKNPKSFKFLAILFPRTFQMHFNNCLIVPSNQDEVLTMSETALGYHLYTHSENQDAVLFIMELFDLKSSEAAWYATIYKGKKEGDSVLGMAIKGFTAAREAHKAKLNLYPHSVVMPDWAELEKRLTEPQFFCNIGQTFMRKNHPNNTYAVIKHNSKVRMMNMTHSTIWDESRAIKLQDLKDWNRTRLTVDEFKKIVAPERFDDFVRVDFKLKPNCTVDVKSFTWEPESKAIWKAK